MLENILLYTHGALILGFGLFLSGAFSGINHSTPKGIRPFFLLFAFCSLLQLLISIVWGYDIATKLYPLTTHLPLILFLYTVYHIRLITSLASVFTAYLFCQPANWFGVIAYNLTNSTILEYVSNMCLLILVAFLSIRYFSTYYVKIYNKDTRSISIISAMPIVYYIFDYSTTVYTDLWLTNNRIVAEFLPFFFVISYLIFTIMFCIENEKKLLYEHKAEIIRISAEQQTKEIEAMKHTETEIRILHHDMRLLFSSLSLCIDKGDLAKAKEILSVYSSQIENIGVKHFCNINTINYVLSDFDSKCKANHVKFIHNIELNSFDIDVTLFCSILSNSLDNALNAQKELDESSRTVKLLLKNSNDKILLSVENPILKRPDFKDGLPVSSREGHGYGTQSIRYMTEKLNGKCKLYVQGNHFITKIII